MTVGIAIACWTFLLLAYAITIADAYFLVRVVLRCREIRVLARNTAIAARGILDNTSGVGDALGGTVELVSQLGKGSGNVSALTSLLRTKLGAR
jgi:hypothetical protein